MKTIFITIFEGVEAKNILRTPVFATLLAVPDVRVVLLTKNPERVAYLRNEFHDPRMIYEVVKRPAVRGLDRLFSRLKFTLLKTESTAMARRMAYEDGGSAFAYYAGRIASALGARPWVRTIVRALDYALVRDDTYAPLFDRYKPDLVFCAHLFDEPEVHLVREARRRGVRTAGLVNSWDKVTARAIMRLLPDQLIVFNEVVKDEVMAHNEMAAQDIYVAGQPNYDGHFQPVPSPREDLFSRIGLSPASRLIVYAPMGSAFSDADWDMTDLLERFAEGGQFGPGAALLVRFQPNDFIDEAELRKRPWLHYDYPGRRFSGERGVDWDMDSRDLQHLIDTLYHSALLICYASSMSVDAAIFDKPVININFEIRPSARRSKSPTQFYRRTHYAKALATGGIRLVSSSDDLIRWVRRYLEDPSLDAEGRRRLVAQQ
ncbi:MAG: hypothetical protein U1A16_02675, partial [Patescibacteria group bacterium]|nr:hypothetical protein [Patescibacteria group bacterium]